MKYQFLVLMAICILAWGSTRLPAYADAPQPGTFQIAFTSNTITLGEPLILKYTVTNSEDKRVSVNIDDNGQEWLNMTLLDSSGHAVQAVTEPLPPLRHRMFSGVALDPNGHRTGYLVVSQKFQPTQAGQYQLKLSVHLTYSADNEQSVSNQNYSLPVTVTARNPQRLEAVAEGFREAVMSDKSISEYQSAIKALFSMRDPVCIHVWQELATDPTLDAFRATDVINELAKVKSVGASDILAEMQPVAPERWTRTGHDPLNALEDMRRNASPEIKQHINQLLVSAGVDLNHVPYGSVN